SAPGMSPLAWPAATSIIGTATTRRCPLPYSSRTASVSGGGDSSMKPPATSRSSRRRASRSTNAAKSATPLSSRVPCPASSSGGLIRFLSVSGSSGRLVSVEQGVERGGGDRRTALLGHVADLRQPAGAQRGLGLRRTDEPHRQPDHQHRGQLAGVDGEQFLQRGGRTAGHP